MLKVDQVIDEQDGCKLWVGSALMSTLIYFFMLEVFPQKENKEVGTRGNANLFVFYKIPIEFRWVVTNGYKR